MGVNKMMNWDNRRTWFHGSPTLFDELLAGSTITQDRHLAAIFSHKPSIVVKDENGVRFHNGKVTGYLYFIDEAIEEIDVYPHPHTTMQPGEEWLIRRPLKVKLIKETVLDANELLSAEEEKSMMRRLSDKKAT